MSICVLAAWRKNLTSPETHSHGHRIDVQCRRQVGLHKDFYDGRRRINGALLRPGYFSGEL